jgi:hypothetical protein
MANKKPAGAFSSLPPIPVTPTAAKPLLALPTGFACCVFCVIARGTARPHICEGRGALMNDVCQVIKFPRGQNSKALTVAAPRTFAEMHRLPPGEYKYWSPVLGYFVRIRVANKDNPQSTKH